MTRIGLISDTHDFLDENVFRHFDSCHEIWHAGDFGQPPIAEKLAAFRPLKGVFGNIDGPLLQQRYPEKLRFSCEEVDVLMTHIGGYTGKYTPWVRKELEQQPANLFISGHSHILKVIFDKKLHCLHMNPGAAGKQGWHRIRTIIRFTIDGRDIRDCEVIELGKR